jgi:MFS family permease
MENKAAQRERPAAAPRWFYAFGPVNIANGATAPLIPLYMVIVLHASVLDVGLVFFFSSLAAVPGAMFWGRLSDRLHRRRAFVLIGLASFALTLPLMALTDSLPVYLAANALLGFLQAAGAATSSVLIMESFPEREWAPRIGRFAQVSGVCFVVGLVLGAFWFMLVPPAFGQAFALAVMFVLAAALSAVSAVLGIATIKEGHRRVDRAAAAETLARLGHSIIERRHAFFMRAHHLPSVSFKSIAAHARQPIGAYCAGILLLFTGFLVFNAPLPVFFLSEAGLAQTLIFWVYVSNSTIAAALYLYAGRRCDDVEPRSLLALAAGSRMIIYPLFAVAVALLGAGNLGVLIALLALNAAAGASWAFINVSSSVLAARLAPANAKAQAMGLYNAAIGAGAIIGSLLGGLLAQRFPYVFVFVAASLIILSGIVVILAAASKVGEDVPRTHERRGRVDMGRAAPPARDL